MVPPTGAARRSPNRRPRASVVALAVLASVLVACGDGGGGSDGAGEDAADGAGTATSEADDAWQIFESAEARFRVELPGVPMRGEQQGEAQGIPLRFVAFTTAADDPWVYSVAYVDYPEAVTSIDPARVLDGVVKGAGSQAGGTITARAPVTADGMPAVDYTIRLEDGQIQARAILAGTRLYLLQQGGAGPHRAGFDRMVGSFELLAA